MAKNTEPNIPKKIKVDLKQKLPQEGSAKRPLIKLLGHRPGQTDQITQPLVTNIINNNNINNYFIQPAQAPTVQPVPQ